MTHEYLSDVWIKAHIVIINGLNYLNSQWDIIIFSTFMSKILIKKNISKGFCIHIDKRISGNIVKMNNKLHLLYISYTQIYISNMVF